MPDTRGTHFNHQIPGFSGGVEDGQRNADFAVIGADGRDRGTRGLQNRCQQVLGRRLACGTGDADDPGTSGAQQLHHMGRQGAHRDHGVVDDDRRVHGAAGIQRFVFGQGQDGAGGEGTVDEVVPVRDLAGFGDEKEPRGTFA